MSTHPSDGHAGRPEIIVADDGPALARAAAERLVSELTAALDTRAEAHLALTGGSTATGLYRELADGWRDAVDWGRVHLWWGDERFVPRDHPESNASLAYATLLSAAQRRGESGVGGLAADVAVEDLPGLRVDADNVHPFGIDAAVAGDDAAAVVAERYADEIERTLPTGDDGLPVFDVILLGIGGDGHILSVFPGSPALADDAPLVLAVPAPDHIGPHLPRLTLNPRLVAAAGRVMLMATGEGKAEPIARALADGPAREVPARLARRPNAVWFLDRAAAARLDQPVSSE